MKIYYKANTETPQHASYLQRALGDYLGVASLCSRERPFENVPGESERSWNRNEIRILREKHGKPYAADFPGITFSVTHTKNWWLCAVGPAYQGPIGIDCENRNRRVSNPQRVARRFFSEEEAAFFSGCISSEGEEAEPKWEDDFLRIWVRKEAYLKYLGAGLAGGMQNFSVADAAKRRILDRVAEDSSVEFASIPVSEELYAVVCRSRSSEDREIVLCPMT